MTVSTTTTGRRWTRALPTTLALAGVFAVWAAGAVWSFEEQTNYATSLGFVLPWLLPLVLDGLAVSLAALAYAAALDGRAAVLARLGTLVAVAASATSNAAWAWTRTATRTVAESTTVMPGTPTGGVPTLLEATHTAAAGAPDVGTVVLAAGVPIAANLAFEVLLSELRRQVQRRRGMPAPVAIPWPRLVRVVLAPWSTFRTWRRVVLDLTAITAPVPAGDVEHHLGVPDAPSPQVAPETGFQAPAPPAPRSAPSSGRPRTTRAAPGPVDVAELLLVGRAVAADLDRRGERLTRRSLVAELAQRGHPIGTTRAGELLAQLRATA